MTCHARNVRRVEHYPFEVNHEVVPETGQVRSELVQVELAQVEEYLPGSALTDPVRFNFDVESNLEASSATNYNLVNLIFIKAY